MKGILIYSGGLDSTVLLHYLVKVKKYEVECLSFNYGQKHTKELKRAKLNAENLNCRHTVVSLNFIQDLFKSNLLDNGEEIPEGHYEDENMKNTVVPSRNLIMASIAAGLAQSRKYGFIALGIHSGDHAIYPDCRLEFLQSLQQTVKLADWHKCKVIAPFVHMDKTEIVKKGIVLDVDFNTTWTCYKGEEKACGKCGSCIERLEAFEKNNYNDSINYA